MLSNRSISFFSEIPIDVNTIIKITATIAKSNRAVGAISAESIKEAKFTSLANGQAKIGDFSMFLNGEEISVEIEDNDTIDDIASKIFEKSNGLTYEIGNSTSL